MDRIDNLLKEELLKQNNKIFFVIIYACGGVMFLKHFYELLGKQDKKLLQRMIDAKLLKTKRLGKSYIIIGKYSLYQHFGLQNKSIVLTSKRILHSALVAEMLIHTYGNDLNRIEKMLRAGNFLYFSTEDSLNFLNRIYCFMVLKKSYELSVLHGSIKEHENKVNFYNNCRKGKRDKLEKVEFCEEDLFTLRSKDIYMRYADFKGDTLRIYVAILSNGKRIDKSKTKVGYEIPFTRFFYKYVAPEKSEDIASRIYTLEAEITNSLKNLFSRDGADND